MFLNFKDHFKKIFFIQIFIFLSSCQIQDPIKHHGIIFLENRSDKLVKKTSNKNDVLQILGQPHSTSINNENIWIYVERTLNKGKYHKLGQHVLEQNNVLVLTFDKYGVLNKKDFYNKNDINKVEFSKKTTESGFTNKSFVEKFLMSVKQKMYGGKK